MQYIGSTRVLLLVVALTLLISAMKFVPCHSFLMHDDIGYGRFTHEDGTTFLLEDDDEHDDDMPKRNAIYYDDNDQDGIILRALYQLPDFHSGVSSSHK